MKLKRVLRKLISLFPEDDYREWYFSAKNKGGAYEPHYGIMKDGGWHGVTGINVKCYIRDKWYFEHWNDEPGHGMTEEKFGNIMAAYVATVCPDNVQALLDEIDALRQGLLQAKQCISNLGHGELSGEAKEIALNEAENIRRLLEEE